MFNTPSVKTEIELMLGILWQKKQNFLLNLKHRLYIKMEDKCEAEVFPLHYRLVHVVHLYTQPMI